METLYGKEILDQLTINFYGQDITCVLLMDEEDEYMDVHVLNDKFRQDEMNTLNMQESREHYHEWNRAKMMEVIMQHVAWDCAYGVHGQYHWFNVEHLESQDL